MIDDIYVGPGKEPANLAKHGIAFEGIFENP